MEHIPGVLPDSEMYPHTPSDDAKNILLYPLGCGKFYTDRNYSFKETPSNGILMAFIELGHGTLTTRLGSYVVDTKDFFMIDLSKPHEFKGICKMLWLRVDGIAIKKMYWTLRKKGGPVYRLLKDSHIPIMINSIIAELRTPEPPREGLMATNIYSILGYLLDRIDQFSPSERGSSAISKKDDSMRQAALYIDKHLADHLTVADIASALNLDRSHFSKDFKEYAKRSPAEYILLKRLDRAKRLLDTTDKSMQEIAIECGFTTASLFSNAFKRREGITPSEFRAAYISHPNKDVEKTGKRINVPSPVFF